MEEHISDQELRLTVDTHGAEAVSLKDANGTEYLWNGDARYWGRHAPVLFPFVGQVHDKKYRYDGVTYPMGQHGFARDNEFELEGKTDHSMIFAFRDTEETRKVYPFRFELEIEYILIGRKVTVRWRVKNADDKTMYFDIGGHPAFMCPLNGKGDWKDYRISFSKNGEPLDHIVIHPLVEGGNYGKEYKTILLENGQLIPTDELFAGDALVLEDHQSDQIALVGPDKKPYLTVRFTSPVVGVWSPVGKHAPFICIEPWYGRADDNDFEGTLKERKYTNALEPGEEFQREFSVLV